MFAKSVLVSSLLALALGKPIERRNSHLSGLSGFNINPIVVNHGGSFDLNSVTVTGFNAEHFSFNNFGGLASLNRFDDFFGQGNFCGVQNVLVQKNIVTCQVSQVNIVQQHLAIVAEYAKRVILTHSCEVEAQVLLFSQFIGGLNNWGASLRHVNGVVPTFDAVVAQQIVNVVDVSGNINIHDFGFVGSTIGSHGVTVLNSNWVDTISPATVGFVWQSAILVAGPQILIDTPSHVNTGIVAVKEHHATIVEHPTIVTAAPVHLPPVVVHQSVPVFNSINVHGNSGIVLGKGESVSTVTSSAEASLPTEPTPLETDEGIDSSAASTDGVDIAAQRSGDIAVATDGADAASTSASETTTDAAAATSTDPAAAAASTAASPPGGAAGLVGRRLPTMIARRAWDSRRRA